MALAFLNLTIALCKVDFVINLFIHSFKRWLFLSFCMNSGRFPGEHGIVAPGLSCQYPVRFAPDSLADYDDFLKVQSTSILIQGEIVLYMHRLILVPSH